MIDGASSGDGNTENHLIIIRTTIYPNVHMKNRSSGKKTKRNFIQSPKYILLRPLIKIPIVMWITPTIMDVFILKEFKKETDVLLSWNAQSKPNDHWQSGSVRTIDYKFIKKKIPYWSPWTL